MTKWNEYLLKSEDTFIANGNPEKLKVIIEAIKSKEVSSILDLENKKEYKNKAKKIYQINHFLKNKLIYFLSLLIPEILKIPIRKIRRLRK